MRVFLASTGSGMSKELRDKTVKICRPRYILETFFNGEKSCLEAMSIVGNDNFLLDSGAFSYMNGAKVVQMDSYIDKYIKFIINYKSNKYFEIDVDNILIALVFGRNKMRCNGYQCIPVLHKAGALNTACKKYSYIAIGGLVFHERNMN